MEASLKKVIFTCGGTAGHVNPAIALAQLMREKDPETEFLFVGAERGLEKDCSGQALFQAACGILHDGARRASMERAMSALGIRDATERIYQTVLEICQ